MISPHHTRPAILARTQARTLAGTYPVSSAGEAAVVWRLTVSSAGSVAEVWALTVSSAGEAADTGENTGENIGENTGENTGENSGENTHLTLSGR